MLLGAAKSEILPKPRLEGLPAAPPPTYYTVIKKLKRDNSGFQQNNSEDQFGLYTVILSVGASPLPNIYMYGSLMNFRSLPQDHNFKNASINHPMTQQSVLCHSGLFSILFVLFDSLVLKKSIYHLIQTNQCPYSLHH